MEYQTTRDQIAYIGNICLIQDIVVGVATIYQAATGITDTITVGLARVGSVRTVVTAIGNTVTIGVKGIIKSRTEITGIAKSITITVGVSVSSLRH